MPDHIFKTSQSVKFIMTVSGFEGTTGSKTFDFTTDGLYQYTNAFVKFKDESIQEKSKITGEVFLKQKYWRGNIIVEFKIPNSSMVTAVRTLLRGLDNCYNLTTTKSTNIIIGYRDTSELMLTFDGYRLVSDVSPSYLSDNIMVGEELELEFEAVNRVTQMPTLQYSDLIDDSDNSIVDHDDNIIIGRG